jgi:pSer/pThr/pTyr-binding forkhead associated (FHA) protein
LQLVVTDGPTAGQRFELHEGETIIGREQGSDIHIDHPTVSHNQAILRVRGHEATIEDLHSTNGTRVNDVLIERQTPIGPGDRIGVGGVHLVVERHEIIRRGERQR